MQKGDFRGASTARELALMSNKFTLDDLEAVMARLEEKTVERPLLVTVKDFEEFNKSIPKFPPYLKLNKRKSEN